MIHNMTYSAARKAAAYISVSYPAGAVCTCAMGGVTLTAGDTSGSWMFALPSAGEWTVSAEGPGSAEQKVTVTEGGHLSLSLGFSLLLFDGGSFAPETGGFSEINSDNTLSAYTGSNSAAGSRGGVYSKALIDLSAYTKLHFLVTKSTQSHNGSRILGISSACAADASSMLMHTESVAVGEQVLDISALDREAAILIYVAATPYTAGTYAETHLVVSRIWAD